MSEWWSPLISSVAGLAGVTIGAWLTGRRERWERKRQVYADVLKALLYSRASAWELAATTSLEDYSSSPSYTEELKALYKEKLGEAIKAQEVVMQTILIAQILLPSDAVEVLERFYEEWAGASGSNSGERADNRVKACDRAIHDLKPIARRDLGSRIGSIYGRIRP